MIVGLDGITHYLVFKLNLVIWLFLLFVNSIPSRYTGHFIVCYISMSPIHILYHWHLALDFHIDTYQFSFWSPNCFLLLHFIQVQMHQCVSLDRWVSHRHQHLLHILSIRDGLLTFLFWRKQKYHLSASIKTMTIIYISISNSIKIKWTKDLKQRWTAHVDLSVHHLNN